MEHIPRRRRTERADRPHEQARHGRCRTRGKLSSSEHHLAKQTIRYYAILLALQHLGATLACSLGLHCGHVYLPAADLSTRTCRAPHPQLATPDGRAFMHRVAKMTRRRGSSNISGPCSTTSNVLAGAWTSGTTPYLNLLCLGLFHCIWTWVGCRAMHILPAPGDVMPRPMLTLNIQCTLPDSPHIAEDAFRTADPPLPLRGGCLLRFTFFSGLFTGDAHHSHTPFRALHTLVYPTCPTRGAARAPLRTPLTRARASPARH